ncbi:MAG: hypothetical protein ACTTH6_01170 [Candidatus Altimarinota bacterium]
MPLPDGKFPSTGADAKPSPHDSLRDNQAPRMGAHHPYSSLIVEGEIFIVSIFQKPKNYLTNKNFYFKYGSQLADRASARIFHGYAAGWNILFDIGLVKHAFRTPY